MVKIVPSDKCPLDVIAEMGDVTKNARIYLEKSAIEKLRSTADSKIFVNHMERLSWNPTDDFPETVIEFYPILENWFRVYRISASDIAFKRELSDPTIIIHLIMEE